MIYKWEFIVLIHKLKKVFFRIQSARKFPVMDTCHGIVEIGNL